MKARNLFSAQLAASLLTMATVAGCHAHPGVSAPASSPPCSPCGVQVTSATTTTPAPAIGGAPDVASLVARVKPVVVNITTTQEVRIPRIPFFEDGPFGNLPPPFGVLPRRPSRDPEDDARVERQALGSGFIVDPRGYVVTNAHVVEHADRVEVLLADDRQLSAKVKGRDERLDLAVLEVEGAHDLPAAVLGSSDLLQVGDYVIAIGNPFGLGHTVTMGIVSAKSRAIGAGPYDDFIQTDASINPGNSGGPLFNTRGEVIGVATAMNPNGRGIGFAIPVDALKDVLPQLVEKGQVTRGQLGIHIQEIDAAMAAALGLDRPRGALVAQVDPKGAAARAGIRAGDVIVGLDGQDVAHSRELPRLVARHTPGAHVKIELIRNKLRKSVDVALDPLDDSASEDREQDENEDSRSAPEDKLSLGLSLDDSARGVVVSRVRPDGPAARAVEPGDLILEIDKKPIKGADEAARALRKHQSGPVLLRIERHGASRFVAIAP